MLAVKRWGMIFSLREGNEVSEGAIHRDPKDSIGRMRFVYLKPVGRHGTSHKEVVFSMTFAFKAPFLSTE